MHNHELSAASQNGLAVYYLLVAILNAGFAYYYLRVEKKGTLGVVWAAVAGVFLLLAGANALHLGLRMPDSATHTTNNVIDHFWGPILFFVGSTVLFVAVLIWRRFFTNPTAALAILNGILLLSGLAMTNKDFQSIVTKEDNVPIVMLIFAVGFASWVGLRRAGGRQRRAHRPRRAAHGEGRREGAGLAGPRLHRTDLHGRLHRHPGGLGGVPEGAPGTAGDQRQGAQPVEGALVLPRPPGNARLL